ncbi:hypothetical protein ACH5RR_008813 [Cinchona calisaya]|uniref:Uncharacterized protein n=1 Tax=Cinchona calisaya TaxID=153742 RepID=A0ABD3ACJ5_9GENT
MLEDLHPHLFNKSTIYSIAQFVGHPLNVHFSTTTIARPSLARACVEINLTKCMPRRVRNGNGEEGDFWQYIAYHDLPKCCNKCKNIGHAKNSCRLLSNELMGNDILKQSNTNLASDSNFQTKVAVHPFHEKPMHEEATTLDHPIPSVKAAPAGLEQPCQQVPSKVCKSFCDDQH